MPRVEQNLTTFQETVSILREFILADDLFWPLQAKGLRGFPRISLGALLLILDELHVSVPNMTTSQRLRFHSLQDHFHDILDEWRIAVGKKAEREIHMRANLWRAYLQDLQENPDLLFDYANEVRNRVMMARLAQLSRDERVAEREILKVQRLEKKQELLQPGGNFVWDERLEATYPFDEYPFLYR